MRGRSEEGQLVLLVICYAMIAATLVLVAVDASVLFLTQRGLAGTADGAAVAAASAIDTDRVYRGAGGDTLPLLAEGVHTWVAEYLADRDVRATYPGLDLLDAGTDGSTVTVRLQEAKQLPFLSVLAGLTGAFSGGRVSITVTAHARAPVR